MTWRRRFLAWVAPVLLLAQIALALHQLEHRLSPDALAPAHECVLCGAAAAAAPPPDPFVVLPVDLGAEVPARAPTLAAFRGHDTAPFRSRAPPASAAL